MKFKKNKFLALVLTLAIAMNALVLPVGAAKRDTATPNISSAFDEDSDKTFKSYESAYGWDDSKNGKKTWTSDITDDDMEWQSPYQMELYYNNLTTSGQHLWGAAGGFSGVSGSLALPTGSGSNIVEVGLSQLGTRETPPKSNCVSYVRWYNGWDTSVPVSSYAPWHWCCIFVVWCASQRGLVDDGTFCRTASCNTQMSYMLNKGYSSCTVQSVWRGEQDVQPGDIMFFSNDGSTSNLSHIGIVVEYNREQNYILTVEGNTNGSCAPDGNGTPGGGVSYQKYTPRTHYKEMQQGYIVRPNYPQTQTPAGEEGD